MKMNELYDFIGKWMRLKQAGKEANLVLNTLAGNAWATLSVCIGHGGPPKRKHKMLQQKLLLLLLWMLPSNLLKKKVKQKRVEKVETYAEKTFFLLV